MSDLLTDLSKRQQPTGVRETRAVMSQFELREKDNGTGGKTLEFNGYACITDVLYEMYDMFGPYEEQVVSGAFKKTLGDGCDTTFLINHEGMSLARTKPGTLRLAEDETGLASQADLDPTTPQVIGLRSAIERGDIDEMSFAFRCIRQSWSNDYMQRDLIELDINKGDVSTVNYGANPYTSDPGMSLRSREAMRAVRAIGLDEMADTLREIRAGASLSATSVATLKHVLSLAATSDDAVDELQVVLSEFLGVPNPDTDPETADDGGDGEQKANNLSLYKARAKLLKLQSH